MSSAFTAEPAGYNLSEPTKLLPIAFIVFNIATLYSIYMKYHCVPLLQQPWTQQQGIWQTAVINILSLMIVYCYLCCSLISPGRIPDAKEWDYVPLASPRGNESQGPQKESKRSGDRRHCKWCAKYKPDRAHHCRVCRTCVLRMDHHCPWIYNCVGFQNHKYFFLLIMYSAMACHTIFWTMLNSVKAASVPETEFFEMFFLLFGESLAMLLGSLTTCFFGFHVWLMMKAMTTIEFCEKSNKRNTLEGSPYDLGFYGNIRAVLGENTLLWFWPASLPVGDGLNWITDESPLLLLTTRDLEAARDMPKPKGGKFAIQKSKKHKAAGTGECGDTSGQESDLSSDHTPSVAASPAGSGSLASSQLPDSGSRLP